MLPAFEVIISVHWGNRQARLGCGGYFCTILMELFLVSAAHHLQLGPRYWQGQIHHTRVRRLHTSDPRVINFAWALLASR